MITNTGRGILSKFLIGETPSYASYLAIGVGAEALAVGEAFPDFANQTALEFEALRVPIVSRGFVYDESGNPSIVFAAEIPGDERYEITEVGVYPGRSNPLVNNLDSKTLFTFSQSENWEYHSDSGSVAIDTIVSPLNLDQAGGTIAVTNDVFRTNSNNTLFASPVRIGLNERPRLLTRSMIIKGDVSFLETVNGNVQVSSAGSDYNAAHIHLNNVAVDLDANSQNDELRIALSLLSKSDTQNIAAESVKVLVEFSEADLDNPTNFARLEVDLVQGQSGVNFTNNRYFVVKKKLSELATSPGFTWKEVNTVRVYASVFQSGIPTPSDNFYVNLDGIRLENTNTLNPLYGLVGYSVMKTSDGSPIVKEANTSNIVEFRFGMEVL